MGRDSTRTKTPYAQHDFNPRAPYGARPLLGVASALCCAISIHAPRMGRDVQHACFVYEFAISIHAPRMGRDVYNTADYLRDCLFQSTRPVWGATAVGAVNSVPHVDFNPRAPYGARLCDLCGYWIVRRYFNPRAPYGARLPRRKSIKAGDAFQSTRPVWGATVVGQCSAERIGISIHAPRMGRDKARYTLQKQICHFNPRAPYGARQQNCTIFLCSFAQE